MTGYRHIPRMIILALVLATLLSAGCQEDPVSPFSMVTIDLEFANAWAPLLTWRNIYVEDTGEYTILRREEFSDTYVTLYEEELTTTTGHFYFMDFTVDPGQNYFYKVTTRINSSCGLIESNEAVYTARPVPSLFIPNGQALESSQVDLTIATAGPDSVLVWNEIDGIVQDEYWLTKVRIDTTIAWTLPRGSSVMTVGATSRPLDGSEPITIREEFRARETEGQLLINGGADATTTRVVSLDLAISFADSIAITNSAEPDSLAWQPYVERIDEWQLQIPEEELSPLTVYVWTRNAFGIETSFVDNILSSPPDPGTIALPEEPYYIRSSAVTLLLEPPTNATHMQIINGTGPFSETMPWRPVTTEVDDWVLPHGDGVKFIQARFISDLFRISEPCQTIVFLDTTAPAFDEGEFLPTQGNDELMPIFFISWPSIFEEGSGILETKIIVTQPGHEPRVYFPSNSRRLPVNHLSAGDTFSWYVETRDRLGHVTTSPTMSATVGSALEHTDSSTWPTIPAGTFAMGSPVDEIGRNDDETLHWVQLTHGFKMQPHEVTNLQFVELTNRALASGLAYLDHDDSWVRSLGAGILFEWGNDGCDIFIEDGRLAVAVEHEENPACWLTIIGGPMWCHWLSIMEGIDDSPVYEIEDLPIDDSYNYPGYRLPTESEWEYACRAGSSTPYNNHSDCLSSEAEANYLGLVQINPSCPSTSGGLSVLPVMSFAPNDFGLFDMHGNVSEFCIGSFDPYPDGTEENPAVDPIDNPDISVVRGGSFYSEAGTVRSAYRDMDSVFHQGGKVVGFRPVLGGE